MAQIQLKLEKGTCYVCDSNRTSQLKEGWDGKIAAVATAFELYLSLREMSGVVFP